MMSTSYWLEGCIVPPNSGLEGGLAPELQGLFTWQREKNGFWMTCYSIMNTKCFPDSSIVP